MAPRRSLDRLAGCVSPASPPETPYGVLTGDLDEYGQPAEDAVLVGLAGDPLYAGVRLLDQQYRLEDVRLLAPVLPRSKVAKLN